MSLNQNGSQWARVLIFVITLTLMTFFYQFYDSMQYSNFIEYPNTVLFPKNYNDSDILDEEIGNGYIVWSASCRIPNISAFHESISNIIRHKWKEIKCPGSKNRALTRLVRNDTSGVTSIKIVQAAISDYSVPQKELECCYQAIVRKKLEKRRTAKDDDRYILQKPFCFQNGTTLPETLEYLYVYCRAKKKVRKLLYQTLHFVVVKKKPHQSSFNKKTKDNETLQPTRTKYNVMLFGIDSISRLNFIRTMPKTKMFLEQHNWTWLEGYNKIGDNTLPNVMAVLTGMNMTQVASTCFSSNVKKMDDCPFIWKDYSQRGYVTAYFEDEVEIGTFNYAKYGFLNAPTDYYGRPYMVAGLRLLNVTRDGGMNYCMGARLQAEYIFDYMTEFLARMQNYNHHHFSLFWFNSFSHNELNQPSVMDKRLWQVLAQMQPYLNNTFVFFLSDHGVRFGPIRETFVGWLEERLPYMYIWAPPSFRDEHPEKYANLVANKNRLTTPFDIHLTLHEILNGKDEQSAQGCPGCRSLFAKVPWNRSCDDAAVTSHWCSCSSDKEFTPSQTDPAVVNAAYVVLNAINSHLAKHKKALKFGTSCAILTLDKVLSVRSRMRRSLLFLHNAMEYILVMRVSPSGALFEATWKSDGSPVKIDDISRINMYGTQGNCVTGGSDLKKYCFCLKNK